MRDAKYNILQARYGKTHELYVDCKSIMPPLIRISVTYHIRLDRCISTLGAEWHQGFPSSWTLVLSIPPRHTWCNLGLRIREKLQEDKPRVSGDQVGLESITVED